MHDGELFMMIPILAIVCGMVVKLAKLRFEQRPAQPVAPRELSGEEALFGLSAAEDLRDIRERLDRLEGQVSQVVRAVQAVVPAPAQAARSLDPIVEPPVPPTPPVVEQRL
jgi:hypothetical protein